MVGISLCLMLGLSLGVGADADALLDTRDLFDLAKSPPPEHTVFNFSSGQTAEVKGVSGLEVHFSKTEWPNITFRAPEPGWDWSGYQGVSVRLFNPGDVAVDVSMRVDNKGGDGWKNCNTAAGAVPPGEHFDLQLRFNDGSPELLWGMRGLPGMPPRGEGAVLDLSRIMAFQVFLSRPQQEHTLLVESARLFRWNSTSPGGVPMPFVNRFGQYMHADWPGKVMDEDDLRRRAVTERKELAAGESIPGRDSYGGWSDGPKREATGWFRTEKVNGKWWLVTPAGTLFLSFGVDCVGTWEQTFVEKRQDWFDGLPGDNEPLAQFYGHGKGAHSMADVIGGEGKTFSFYRANLFRKYGDQWPEEWRQTVGPRLKSWGFNTIANWSQEDAAKASGMPFTASTGLQNVPKIEGARGYWAKMMDVYDPAFAREAAQSVQAMTAPQAANPLCIGYFVDNELAWEGINEGVLSSKPDQPARRELMEQLQHKYADIDKLNTAWGTAFAAWENLTVPPKPTEDYKSDMSSYLYHFALKYFSVLRDEIRRCAPNQLYLGCRFAMAPDEAVRACAETADILSFNLYYREIPKDKWLGPNGFDRPAIVGEFHFGALDRGMFHCGLVRTRNQDDRARCLAHYLESVADHPLFVGCHWFQYTDEPVTGRWYDGENYNIGLVDITDTPYPEMAAAARATLSTIYTRRAGHAPHPAP